ncbi:Membrane-bound metallopeptidase [Neorhizobium galegae bv. officinalis]|uniref:Membrane-bound metallopeptidase n=1 Tax=Neorhizobium galegae bv. officinalis TaxID=323656 RepID=A0A0T7FSZ6_NEOGA|nr:murein hydrolase activator EnvC [Neorhizobium galegae]CDZ38140.1 Membrane-bound metallopeptidase [Neorhizobium galegae bv. officinalis]
MRTIRITSYRRALLLAAGLGFALVPPLQIPTTARAQNVASPTAPQAAPAAAVDPTADLQRRRNETRGELEVLTKSMKISGDRAAAIEKTITDIRKNTADVRQALIDSAARRKSLEIKILDSGKKITELKLKEDGIRTSLRSRRAVLAEVLAALQRMGRNPPPALLVTPDDALASVRSAILLGAVVPGMRHEADKLVADLQSLASLQALAMTEKTTVSTTIAASLEEDRRMALLLAENEKLNKRNTADLDAERRRSEELTGRATTLENLIQSFEGEIASVREAIDQARAEEERQRMMSEAERERAKQLAQSGVPDKNRIAPAYAFSSLKQKLELPVAGDVLRWFGDADGTGHTARGMTVASNAGAVVTAPADGLVVFAGAFRSYGQMIILNAGDGYHLVLTGMDVVNARQGKFVFAGEPIAVMGEKRVASATALALETDRPTLYIEFRKDGTPVDSKPWWTSKETGRARNDS